MKLGTRQAWGKDWSVLLQWMKSVKVYPIITQHQMVSKLLFQSIQTPGSVTLSRFATSVAGKKQS